MSATWTTGARKRTPEGPKPAWIMRSRLPDVGRWGLRDAEPSACRQPGAAAARPVRASDVLGTVLAWAAVWASPCRGALTVRRGFARRVGPAG